MTPTTLDSVLKSSLTSAAGHGPIEGEKLADARAQVLEAQQQEPVSLQPDRFTPSEETDDSRLGRALRAIAERYQAGSAAPVSTPLSLSPGAPAPGPAVSAPAGSSSTSNAGGNGNGSSNGQKNGWK